MTGVDIFPEHVWYPLAPFGIDSSYFAVNPDTLIYTWIALGVITVLALLGRWALAYPDSIPGYLAREITKSFMGLIEQSFASFNPQYCIFIATLFIFIFTCNSLVLLPGAEEPTNDINTTFAFALVSFCYIQKETIRSHGLAAYIQEYIKLPFNWLPEKKTLWLPIQFIGRCIANICTGALSLPFELLSKIASVLSLSLRLFGNILGGSIITSMLNKAVAGSLLYQTIALATGLNLIITLFFGLFEAGIQAFVFTLLSLTYLSMGVKK